MTLLRALSAGLCATVLVACAPGSPTASPPEPTPGPAADERARPGTYLALGDSVAAGVGARRPDADGYVPRLHALLRDRLGCDGEPPAAGCPLRLANLAVGGATTASLLSQQLPAALALLQDDDVRLVTVTIGGNDVFEPVVRACAADPGATACRQAVEATLQRADAGLDRVLQSLRAAAGPSTPIAVMTYYDPLPACRLASLQPLAAQVLEGGGDGRGLNDLIRARAAEHDVLVVETAERLRAPADFVGDTDCLHPSPSGHERLAEAFADAVGALG